MKNTKKTISNKNYPRVRLWKTLASCGLIIGVSGVTIGAIALAMHFQKSTSADSNDRDFTISKTSNVIPYESSYASSKITVDFNKPGQEWAKWSIVDDSNPFYDPTDHILSSDHLRLYPDMTLSSSTREVYRVRYLTPTGITNPKEVHISVTADGVTKQTAVWLLPIYNDVDVTPSLVHNLVFTFKSTQIPNTTKRVPLLQGGSAAVNKILELIHYKPDYDFSFENPWSYNVQNYFTNNFDARDMALFFVTNFATRLESAAVDTEETITIHDIATDPTVTSNRQTGFALDISCTFTSPNTNNYNGENAFYHIQTVKNERYDASHSFPSKFNYNACINAAFSNNPTSTGYGYQFNVSGSPKDGFKNVCGWSVMTPDDNDRPNYIWNDDDILSLYMNRSIWLTTSAAENLEDVLLMGTLFPSEN